MIYINHFLFDSIKRYFEEVFPNEGCGIVGGRIHKECIYIYAFFHTKNSDFDNPKTRYVIDPREHLNIQKKISILKLDLVGFLHSHPNSISLPSQFDISHSFEGYVYGIFSIYDRKFKDVRFWQNSNNEIIYLECQIV